MRKAINAIVDWWHNLVIDAAIVVLRGLLLFRVLKVVVNLWSLIVETVKEQFNDFSHRSFHLINEN